MVCSHCGYSNDASDRRCSRCGRPMQLRMGAYWRRSGLESQSPLSALAGAGLAEPPPPRQPLWKQELNRKLEGYRDRQNSGTPGDLPPAAAPTLPAPKSGTATAVAAGSPGRTLPPLKPQTGGPGAGNPLAHKWRKIEPETSPKTGSLPRATNSLPTVPRGAPTVQNTLVGVRPKGAGAGPQTSDAVVSSSPIAPLPIRAVAAVLDLAIIVVALGIFLAVFYLVGQTTLTDPDDLRSIAVAFLGIVCFYWIFYLGYLGGTTGMHWLGLRVLNFDGDTPTAGQRRTRALGTILSTLSLGLGFAWSMADEEKLTWHDRMSKTFVTRDGQGGFRSRSLGAAGRRKPLPDLQPNARA